MCGCCVFVCFFPSIFASKYLLNWPFFLANLCFFLSCVHTHTHPGEGIRYVRGVLKGIFLSHSFSAQHASDRKISRFIFIASPYFVSLGSI